MVCCKTTTKSSWSFNQGLSYQTSAVRARTGKEDRGGWVRVVEWSISSLLRLVLFCSFCVSSRWLFPHERAHLPYKMTPNRQWSDCCTGCATTCWRLWWPGDWPLIFAPNDFWPLECYISMAPVLWWLSSGIGAAPDTVGAAFVHRGTWTDVYKLLENTSQTLMCAALESRSEPGY